MFNSTHILYMVISVLVTAGLFVLCSFFVKSENGRRNVLKASAIVTVILHYSSLWVDYLSTGSAYVPNVMILPVYPCNICMWLLVIAAFCKRRNNVAYTLLTEGTFWVGTVCGFVGILLNENYANNPSLADWDILKGLLSHSTMIFGTIYLLVGKFVKIRVFNVFSVTSIFLLFLAIGASINGLFTLCELDSVNAMFLQKPPYEAFAWLNTWTIGLAAIIIVFSITALYERIKFPKEERWHTKIKILLNKNKGEQQ